MWPAMLKVEKLYRASSSSDFVLDSPSSKKHRPEPYYEYLNYDDESKPSEIELRHNMDLIFQRAAPSREATIYPTHYDWICTPSGIFTSDNTSKEPWRFEDTHIDSCIAPYMGDKVDKEHRRKAYNSDDAWDKFTYHLKKSIRLLDMSMHNTLNYVKSILKKHKLESLVDECFPTKIENGSIGRNNSKNRPDQMFEADKRLVEAMMRYVDGFQGWIHPKMSEDTNREALILNFNDYFTRIESKSDSVDKRIVSEEELQDLDQSRIPPPPPAPQRRTRPALFTTSRNTGLNFDQR